MIAGIPPSEKQAFFSLLDEYFASRPHRLPPSSSASSSTSAAPPRGVAGLTERATTSISTAAGTAASSAVTSALRDQFARTGLTKSSPAPPQPSYASNPPTAAARTLPPPTRTATSIPSPSTPNLPPGVIASATVLYDYADGSDPDDLVAKHGETVYLTEKISDDWWRATSQSADRTGIIPSSYVRVL